MSDAPTESDTKEVPVETTKDPVEEFKKGKAKREAKRKEVKVITEYVPEVPPPAPEPAVDVDSIVDRVTQALFDKMAVEKVKTPPKAKVKAPAKKKSPPPPPPPPPTKYFGWC